MKIARFGEGLPFDGICGSWEFLRTMNGILAKTLRLLSARLAQRLSFPEGARPAYKFHLDRDMKRYKDALNELVGLINSNAKVIQSMGGILPGDWGTTRTCVFRLRAKIQKGELTNSADARERIVKLFDNSTVLQKPAYAKIRSKF